MKRKILSATMDFVFKLIFGDAKNADILAAFLMAVLRLPVREFDSLIIIDPHLPKGFKDDKRGVLDVKLRLKSGKVLDIEIQVEPMPFFQERVVFYISKMVTEQIQSGNEYSVIKPVMSIIITDFPLYSDDAYHHSFELYDKENNTRFTDVVGVHTLELTKLPAVDDGSELCDWLKFIKSDDEEELQMLAQKSPELHKAVGIIMEISQDEQMRLQAEAYEKYRRDQSARLWGAQQAGEIKGRVEGKAEGKAEGRVEGRVEGIITVAQRMLKRGKSINEVAEDTGLSIADIERLAHGEDVEPRLPSDRA
jgi:predicted transposase/invertase (TIGR01784 family)